MVVTKAFEQYVFSTFWPQSRLIRSRAMQRALMNSSVCIAGIGGFGCTLTEALARIGIGRLLVTDVDGYDSGNLNRQIYSTRKTIGRHKAVVAAERIIEINPFYELGRSLHVVREGITLHNYLEVTDGYEVICNQTDNLVTFLLLDYAARTHRTVVVNGGRAGWPDRLTVTTRVYDYRHDVSAADDDFYAPTRWGVDPAILARFMESLQDGAPDSVLAARLNLENRDFRRRTLLAALKKDPVAVLGPGADLEDVFRLADTDPDFYKRCSDVHLAMITGNLAAEVVCNILTGAEVHELEISMKRGIARKRTSSLRAAATRRRHLSPAALPLAKTGS